jgi:hypothetical protein
MTSRRTRAAFSNLTDPSAAQTAGRRCESFMLVCTSPVRIVMLRSLRVRDGHLLTSVTGGIVLHAPS